MSYPKNRTIVYIIVRTQIGVDEEGIRPVLLDSFRTYEQADNRKGAYEQQFIDNDLEGMYTFSIQTSMYYD